MKNLIYLLSICCLFCYSIVSLTAQCMLVEITIEDRINESVMIVEGKILSKRTFWDDNRGNIFTANRIKVSKVFKGELQINEIELLTRGGVVGSDAQTDHPSLQVSNQEIGIFFLIENRELTFGNSIPGIPIFQPSMGPQGFVKYNLKEGTARDPFKLYEDINIELYQKIESITNQSFVKVSSFDISTITNPISYAEVTATITSFSPETVTAGTKMQLTINGTGFGAAQGVGFVEFSNADDGGTTFIKPLATEYVSWSDLQIVVEVPTKAGTGDFKVTPDGGGAGTSLTSLTVSWAQLNVTYLNPNTSITNTHQTQHIDDNGSGGYTWTYNTSFSSGSAVDPFVRALQTLCTATNIYWMPEGTTTTIADADADGTNIVSFDIGASPLPGGVLGRMTSRWSGCVSGGNSDWYVSELDMLLNDDFTWNYGTGSPGGSEFDFESVALHELGHGHQLGHIIESTATVMHYSFTNGTTRRVLAATEEAGADDVYARSTTATVCGVGLMATTFSCTALPIELLSFTGNQQNESILLNWKTATEVNNDYFTLEHSTDGYDFKFLTEVDGKGNSTITNDYRFVHLDPTVGTNYYRLSQTDFDGTTKVEDVIAVDYKSGQVIATVVPNPIRQNEINLNYISPQNSDVEIEVIDMTGKVLIQTTVSVVEGENNIQLPAENWSSGIYYLRTIQNQTIKSIKFVKTN